MEQFLREALYATNRALGHAEEELGDHQEVHNLRSARDQLWMVGVRQYGWDD